ncbi:MAG: hypothetical protein Q4A98_09355 [Comamonadaceae bacterium]|nr:hypothetical protein [Comamonadaceae bacterium]
MQENPAQCKEWPGFTLFCFGQAHCSMSRSARKTKVADRPCLPARLARSTAPLDKPAPRQAKAGGLRHALEQNMVQSGPRESSLALAAPQAGFRKDSFLRACHQNLRAALISGIGRALRLAAHPEPGRVLCMAI